MANYKCVNDTYFSENVNGNITTIWYMVGFRNFFPPTEGLIILSSDKENAGLYVFQKLYYTVASNFIYIAKFDSKLVEKWNRVYYADFDNSEKPFLDESSGHLYVILYNQPNNITRTPIIASISEDGVLNN